MNSHLKRVFGVLWMPREVTINVAYRVETEFIPPVVAGAVWLAWNWPEVQNFTSGLEYFTKAFITVAFVWWNFLRIQHQLATKHQQSGIARGVDKVEERFVGLGKEVQAAKDMLVVLQDMVQPILHLVPDDKARDVKNVIHTANTHIDAANNAVRNYVLKADAGQFKITMDGGPTANT